MNAREANLVLTTAALLDPRMKRLDVDEQADMATMWAEVLDDAGVTVDDAISAVKKHYATSRDSIMAADIVAACGTVEPETPTVRDLDPEWLLETKTRALAELGYTPEQYDTDPKVQADVAARWTAREVTGG